MKAATIPASLALIMCYVMSAYGIHCYKKAYDCSPPLHETALTTMLGVLVGFVIVTVTGEAVRFDNDLFFYLVLPPIIFSAGYNLKRKRFFKYAKEILIMGIGNTMLSFFFMATMAKFYSVSVKAVYSLGFVMTEATFNSLDYSLSWIQAFLLASVLSASDEVSACL